MSRSRKTPDPNDAPAEDLAKAVFEHLLALHDGDPVAVLRAMNEPGGYIEQILGAAGEPGQAFGLGVGGSPAGSYRPAARSKPEFTLADAPQQVATLRVRIDIDEARPPIWRRLELAGDLTLSELHLVIQEVFAWEDYHLHMFMPEINGARNLRARSFSNEGVDHFDDVEEERMPDESVVRLDQVVQAPGDRLFYEYDLGDGWRHTLKVEKVLNRREGEPRAVCLAGRRAGPPEDSGGIWQYNEIVAAMAGEESELDESQMAELLEWLGDFDPVDPQLDDLDLDGLLTMHAVASVVAPQLLDNPRLSTHARELVARAEDAGVLTLVAPLFAAAELHLTADPPSAALASVLAGLTDREAEAAITPWRMFLAEIGPDGAELTAAGNLRPAMVETLFTALDADEDDRWGGNRFREDQTLPVANLRQAAMAIGLVRKNKGRLLPTKAVTDTNDPIHLWRQVATNLTRARDEYHRHCAVLALLFIASAPRNDDIAGATVPGAGRPSPIQEAFRDVAPDMLGYLGWRRGAAIPDGWHAWHSSATVWTAFDHPACITSEGVVTPAGRRLARAALLSG
ncbi:MAG: plasmid pRiA4b ORF-3 family protein [Dermatophilus congolensis]|nr:plasmid pRiA4b ORF-3 family protein [Dermatophilus congolensis]